MKVRDIIGDHAQWMPAEGYARSAPTVSVLFPTFKRAQSGYFQRAVNSVLNQRFKDLELIIIDDCSTDGTFDLIQAYMKQDTRVSCIRHAHNIGLPAISEYEGYLRARGKYIAFIFDDNEWDGGALAKTIRLMEADGIKACYGVAHSVYGDGGEYAPLGDDPQLNQEFLQIGNFIANGALVLHRDVLETVGLYDPHLSLTRNCDYDLLRRIAEHYDIIQTGIYFTKEYGNLLSDSLGNSLKSDQMVSEEYMRIFRNDRLLPACFGEYDILDLHGGRSRYFVDAMVEYTAQYKEKQWFDPNDAAMLRLHAEDAVNPDIRYILVVTNDVTASVTLSFLRLFRDGEHVVKICLSTGGYDEFLLLSDMLVICRDLVRTGTLRKKAALLNIPMYYYVDDNFTVLASEFPNDLDIQAYAQCMTRDNLEVFEGVFASTMSLAEYFESLHPHVKVLEPAIGDHAILPAAPLVPDGPVHIACFGSVFRNEYVARLILPAAQRLAEEVPVTLYCPEEADLDDKARQNPGAALSIVKVPRRLSLDAALAAFGGHGIHIQAHCAPRISNSPYKTKNALINATHLGAVLVASRTEPFTAAEGDEGCYLLADNTIQAWYEAFKTLVENTAVREEMREKAKAYCLDRYSAKRTQASLSQEAMLYGTNTAFRLARRSRALGKYRAQQGEGGMDTDVRVIESRYLAHVANVQKPLRYGIVCGKDAISSLGIVFTVPRSIHGSVTLAIKGQGSIHREVSLDMTALNDNDWTFFSFPVLREVSGKLLTCVLSFHYEKGSSGLGLYEDMRHRPFVYKALHRLGCKPKGKNALYFQCV